MKNKKSIKIAQWVYDELILIAAETNAKGVGTFMEDFFQHWTEAYRRGVSLPSIPPVQLAADEPVATPSNRVDEAILYDLRVMAAKNNGMSLKAYMEALHTWLAKEHIDHGRYWFDDTPAQALPVRTRGRL